MRHDGELFFLRPDHPSHAFRTCLGSASLIQDDAGRWLADHRFYPYGETRRSDGASESYPTDKLFTGMLYNSYIRLTRIGARWYDAYSLIMGLLPISAVWLILLVAASVIRKGQETIGSRE